MFRAQTQQYLDQHDAVRVKTVLSSFLKEQDLDILVSGLLEVLDTPEKKNMLPTIKSLIPSKYSQAFEAAVAQGPSSSSSDPLAVSWEGL